MRSLTLPLEDADGQPIVGVLPRLGDRMAVVSAASHFMGWRDGDQDKPDDAPDDWQARPSAPQQDENLAYTFAALIALCWPGGRGVGDASTRLWRKLRSEHRTTSAEHSSSPHEHVVPFGEVAFEALLEDEGIGQVALFDAGLLVYGKVVRTIPNIDRAARLADFSQAPTDGSN